MAKTLKNILATEVAEPKSPDERRFKDKHITVKHKDRNGNDDKLFNASNIKTVDRSKEGHGYNPGEDEKVYEEKMTAADKAKEKAIKKKVDSSGMKSSMKKQYGEKKGEQVYFATIRKKAMESVELDEMRSALLTQDHADAKGMTPEQKKAKHDRYLKIAAEHGKRMKDQSLTQNQRMASSSVHTAAKMAAAEWKNKYMKEEVEQIDEAVAADMYDAHHARALKSLANMTKHLEKHKKLCTKNGGPHSWHASDMKMLSRNLEDMEHGMAQTNEYSQPIATDKVAG